MANPAFSAPGPKRCFVLPTVAERSQGARCAETPAADGVVKAPCTLPYFRRQQSSALPERFEAVQGLRVVAMLMVFSFHWNQLLGAKWPNPFSSWFLSQSNLGTNLFLCIAGCFLHASLTRRPTSYKDFLARRFWRLYPVYAFVLTLVVVLDTLAGSGRTGLTGHWQDLWLLGSNYLLVPALLEDRLIVDASWTLAYIAVFTLFAPYISRLLQSLPAGSRVAAAAAFWLFSLAASYSLHWFSPRVSLLAAGIFVWEALQSQRRWPLVIGLSLLVLALGASLKLALVPPILMVFLIGPGPVRAALSTHALQTLGERSYSFYLCHGIPVVLAGHFLSRCTPVEAGLLTLAVIASALLFSEFVYRTIELPLRTAPKLRSVSRHPASRPTASLWAPMTNPDRLRASASD